MKKIKSSKDNRNHRIAFVKSLDDPVVNSYKNNIEQAKKVSDTYLDIILMPGDIPKNIVQKYKKIKKYMEKETKEYKKYLDKTYQYRKVV